MVRKSSPLGRGASAHLVWRIDHEWEEREEGEDEICRLHIDGAALTVRREATGLV